MLLAGVGKLADRRGTRESLDNFGAPRRPVPLLVFGLPLGEIAIGIALLLTVSAAWAVGAAAALLAVFAVAIVRVLRVGDAPDCHCFGAMRSAPVSGATLARTLGLAVLAAGAAAVEWVRGSTSACELAPGATSIRRLVEDASSRVPDLELADDLALSGAAR